jgi:hypothetical protein
MAGPNGRGAVEALALEREPAESDALVQRSHRPFVNDVGVLANFDRVLQFVSENGLELCTAGGCTRISR